MPLTITNNNNVVGISQEVNTIQVGMTSAFDASASATESAIKAQAWAEGTLPGGTGTKSAREWVDLAEEAADRAETLAVWPNPTYFLHAGQSNAYGANGATSAYWPGAEYAGLAYVWVPSLNAWRDVTTRNGLQPFNWDGSNNAGVWAAVDLAKRRGVTVRMITSYSSGTQIYAWSGGGYNAGTPITTNRTVSAANRVLCYNLETQIAAAGIPRIHAIGWQQGEADYQTPDAAYVEEMDFLRDYFSGLGSDPDHLARVPFAVSALYSGINVGGTERRNQCIIDYCRARSDVAGLIATDDLTGDATGNPSGGYKHFDDLSLKTIGLRMASAIESVWYGRSGWFDPALDALRLKIGGVYPSRLGHRTYEIALAAGSYDLALRGDTPAYRGETYQIAGAVTLNLDATAAPNMQDGGAGFEFYIVSPDNSVTITCDDGAGRLNYIHLFGTAAPATGNIGITISGQRGRGRVIYEFNRWVVLWERLQPRIAPGLLTLPGDNGYTVTIDQGAYISLTGTLTAARTFSIGANGATPGDVLSVRRTGGGAYNWTVRDSTVTTSSIVLSSAGQWVDMLFDGSKWVPWRS